MSNAENRCNVVFNMQRSVRLENNTGFFHINRLTVGYYIEIKNSLNLKGLLYISFSIKGGIISKQKVSKLGTMLRYLEALEVVLLYQMGKTFSANKIKVWRKRVSLSNTSQRVEIIIFITINLN